jgi:hypothetical protein
MGPSDQVLPIYLRKGNDPSTYVRVCLSLRDITADDKYILLLPTISTGSGISTCARTAKLLGLKSNSMLGILSAHLFSPS